MALDAIIFDFDGVIVDTETLDYELWREFYAQHGLELDVALWLSRVGGIEEAGFNPRLHFQELTGKVLDEAFRKTFFDTWWINCTKQPVLPGVLPLLRQARQNKIKLGVASNSSRQWVEGLMRPHSLLEYFDCVRTRDDVANPKPAPDLYLSVAACLGVDVKHCVAIEDSPNGIMAAQSAGIRTVAVPNPLTTRLVLPETALTLRSLADCTLHDLQSLI
ncbi:MAG TPA: HAD family phosphatase [Aggregatilineales bacterium]|nr:HAD family phosphatase [Aggregatilineales bacterium]